MKWFFPGNGELTAFWVASGFTGDFLAPLSNTFCALILVVATICLCHELRLPTELCHVTTFAAIANNIVFHQLSCNKNDLAAAGVFVSAVFYLLRFLRLRRHADQAFFFICVGILIGVKYYALLYAALLVAVFLFSVFVRYGRLNVLHAAVSGIAPIVSLGGFWYLRNWMMTGLPLYPKPLWSSAGAVSVDRDFWHTTLLGNKDSLVPQLWLEALGAMMGPVNLIAVSMLPVSIAILSYIGVRYSGKDQRKTVKHLTFATLLMGSAAIYLITPFVVESAPGTLQFLKQQYVAIRLGFIPLYLSVIGFSYAACSLLKLRWINAKCRHVHLLTTSQNWVAVLILCAVIYQVLFVPRYVEADNKVSGLQWLPVMVLAAIIFAVSIVVLYCVCRNQKLWLIPILALISIIFAGYSGQLSKKWHRGFSGFYADFFGSRIFEVMEERRFSHEKVLVLCPRSYPFMGSRRKTQLQQAFRMPAVPEPFRDVSHFWQELERLKSDFIVTQYATYHLNGLLDTPGIPVGPHGERIIRIWSDSSFTLFQVDRPARMQ
jgi:hypothetical protein